mmetsp:Transcript_4578/g.12844  ORF Transcript_4578/g.12844 Transcript_4578/m.12844 type:complete len:246 (-) Transcript_4578:603-1340(-)
MDGGRAHTGGLRPPGPRGRAARARLAGAQGARLGVAGVLLPVAAAVARPARPGACRRPTPAPPPRRRARLGGQELGQGRRPHHATEHGGGAVLRGQPHYRAHGLADPPGPGAVQAGASCLPPATPRQRQFRPATAGVGRQCRRGVPDLLRALVPWFASGLRGGRPGSLSALPLRRLRKGARGHGVSHRGGPSVSRMPAFGARHRAPAGVGGRPAWLVRLPARPGSGRRRPLYLAAGRRGDVARRR